MKKSKAQRVKSRKAAFCGRRYLTVERGGTTRRIS
ncbi:unnamed protein product [Acanthoscelides obtectus]|uniref:Uncharacterized protein n=1 Tax=Acanthoscelides obtectus TaxID=200917 RepID=A0A9P0PGM3_ACAOB|nr:unnamed protein product [Acanthoscelides obtectus]CAK1630403.1 hypothetical protein AOBTE_LOCUS6304 [Acanthoscelides obtectus]